MNDYHNTNGELGIILQNSRKKASTQQMQILKFFFDHPTELFTPFEVRQLVGLQAPITSIRRAITNLTDANKLIKTDVQKPGAYNKVNYCWRFNTDLVFA